MLNQSLEPLLRHQAQSSMLLQAVLQQHIPIRQTSCVQVVQQPMSLRVKWHGFHTVVIHTPLTEESQCPHFVLHLCKSHDVQSPLQQMCESVTIEAHEARQRTYINISLGILPQSFCLHLRQSVLRHVSPISQMALHLCLNADGQAQH